MHSSFSETLSAFSANYRQAREQFLAAAQIAGAAVNSFVHPLIGAQNETLSMDVALLGNVQAKSLLILTSACHGVEGFCGSGAQITALRDADWLAAVAESGVAVLLIHALNPHGFSYLRRVTNEGVDLNRNFHAFDQALPINEGYQQLHPLLIPDHWPPAESVAQALEEFVASNSPRTFESVVTRGQHTHQEGLFYGGVSPTWSNQTLRQVLNQYGGHCKNLAWIDYHTGLGPRGLCERIFACADDKAAFGRANAWWSTQGATPVTSIYDGSSSSALLTGLMWNVVAQECPQAQYTGIAMEYGTVPTMQVINALRADHWLQLHPDTELPLKSAIKRDIRDAFYCDADDWKLMIIAQSQAALYQAIAGLRSR